MWSLSKEVRQNEQRNKQRIQNRQKHQAKLDKLTKCDPIRLHKQLRRLRNESQLQPHQTKKLKQLEDEWQFIIKNKLHKSQVDEYLAQEAKREQEAERNRKKLWGLKSVYFNPELNPLGKVPTVEGVRMENLTKPLPSRKIVPDQRISDWGITLPEGVPPRFYKKPQNVDAEQAAEPQAKRQKIGNSGSATEFK